MQTLVFYLLLFTLGLVFGSFATSLTWRLVNGISLIKGRSMCPSCKKQIVWYDNIPLLSYLILKGKCRNCKKKISLRYPLTELFMGFSFVFTYYFFSYCWVSIDLLWAIKSPACNIFYKYEILALPYLLFVIVTLVSIFVIDWEHQIIPDELNLLLYGVLLLLFVLFPTDRIYIDLLSGLGASVVLLGLHLMTKGKGMGLGDVKLALFVGAFMGWPSVLIWLFLAFLTGAIAGIILILGNKKDLKSKIAFGPFLVLSFFLTLFLGGILSKFLIYV